MDNILIEVMQELRRRKNRTVRRLYYSEDVKEFTIIPVGDKNNMVKGNFNFKPGDDWDAVRIADWIEHQLSDPETVPQNRNA